jgi:hypothetical protein
MTSNINIPKTSRVNKMKNLVGKKITKKVNFMGEQLVISKLTVSQVMEIQILTQANADRGDADEDGFEIMKSVIKMSVPEALELSDEDFDSFPVEELSTLTNEIMKYSGMDPQRGK